MTLSSHIVFLAPISVGTSGFRAADVDQELLFPSRKPVAGIEFTPVLKATTSVLLTIAVPEESISRREEIDLLTCPQGIWTVMVVNCDERLARDMEQEPTEHLTPIAQYLRGITYSLRTQITNAEFLYDQLKERLARTDDGSLFDDERFTKSNLYHWTVKTCDELRESLTASHRYVIRAFNKQITSLCDKAHDSEQVGVQFWKAGLDAEMYALEELASQISVLNSQVQESVST